MIAALFIAISTSVPFAFFMSSTTYSAFIPSRSSSSHAKMGSSYVNEYYFLLGNCQLVLDKFLCDV
jgi:hypothetical protein